MIRGIGIDIVEIERIKDIVERQPKFVHRILTEQELERYYTLQGHRRIEFLGGRFAAKEAFSKAFGTGIGKELSFSDIEVLANVKGKPEMVVHKGEIAQIHLSISHSRDYCVAQVILEDKIQY